MNEQTPEHFDVLVIGAGLSGIGSAWHLQSRCPDRTWAVFEARDAMGGTWDLFRYPGIRSDSDMFTLGYRFRPWRDPKSIADGPSIKAYVEEVAREHGIESKIRFQHRMVRAEWSSDEARWTVDAEVGPERRPARFTCGFLHACTGYYRYDRGYTPEWPGTERFRGRMVHPQRWPEDLDYRGKRVIVIGSGATAVTLVPALLEGPAAAAHVTMLQRSPTYIVGVPSRDRIANALRKALPERLAYWAVRWKNVLRQMFYYRLARRRPGAMKGLIRKGVQLALGEDYDVDTHFAPNYEPWDQRLCLVPDNDLFRAIRKGRASVVTDQIDTFTETGIRLRSGEHLEADIVVTATGLEVEILHGVTLTVDGREIDLSKSLSYKGMMYSDVPNLASSLGYTNASWTLRADLVAEHICRLLNYMRRHEYAQCTPRRRDSSIAEEPVLNLNSGYIRRALPRMPKQGSRAPWRFHQNYVKDLFALRLGRVADPALEFRGRPERANGVGSREPEAAALEAEAG